jgi:hypothetical protein
MQDTCTTRAWPSRQKPKTAESLQPPRKHVGDCQHEWTNVSFFLGLELLDSRLDPVKFLLCRQRS